MLIRIKKIQDSVARKGRNRTSNADSKEDWNISSRVHRSSLPGRGMIRRQFERTQESASGKNKDITASWERLGSFQRWRQTVGWKSGELKISAGSAMGRRCAPAAPPRHIPRWTILPAGEEEWYLHETGLAFNLADDDSR